MRETGARARAADAAGHRLGDGSVAPTRTAPALGTRTLRHTVRECPPGRRGNCQMACRPVTLAPCSRPTARPPGGRQRGDQPFRGRTCAQGRAFAGRVSIACTKIPRAHPAGGCFVRPPPEREALRLDGPQRTQAPHHLPAADAGSANPRHLEQRGPTAPARPADPKDRRQALTITPRVGGECGRPQRERPRLRSAEGATSKGQLAITPAASAPQQRRRPGRRPGAPPGW
jgi:hypothetical protein